MIERYGRVKTQVVPHAKKTALIPIIQNSVEEGSVINTDQLHAYEVLEF